MPLDPLGVLAGVNPFLSNAFNQVVSLVTGKMTDQPVTLADGLTVLKGITSSSLTLTSPLTVPNGGTGASTLAVNGVLYGNGTSSVGVSSAGSSNMVFATTSSGTSPAFTATPIVQSLTTSSGATVGTNLSVSGLIDPAAITKFSGDATVTGTDGYVFQIFSGQAFHDQHATQLNYRCGTSSTETGQTRTWLAVTTNTGAVGLPGKVNSYGGVTTAGGGLPAIYGLDNRTGLTTADGAATTLYTATAANQLFRLTADIFATAAVTGTATYTLTWTENSTSQTLVVQATTVNVLATATDLIRPDNATTITARLTGVFTGTFSVAGLVEQLA